jgi:hypothetical protein
MSFVICSYFTEATPYADEAKELAQSARAVGVHCALWPIQSVGSWQDNTLYKANFVKSMLDFYPGYNVIYVDADARFRQYPALFDSLDCDMAAYFRDWRFAKNELLSGTLYVRNNDIMRQVIGEWIKENLANRLVWEQKNLQAVISRHPDLKIYRLPVEYCCIFDSEERRNGCRPVIEHLQRSRRYRRLVNAH